MRYEQIPVADEAMYCDDSVTCANQKEQAILLSRLSAMFLDSSITLNDEDKKKPRKWISLTQS